MRLYVDIEKEMHGFNLKVAFNSTGNVTGLLGASGAGKSMTLRCIAGLETPTKGKIVLNNKILFDSEKKINLPSRKRRIGFLFQNYALFPHMTVEENIKFGLSNLPKQEQSMKAAEKINMMQLNGFERRFPSQLSGGQQQRVALARALAVEPEVLLLDEPFSALDSHLKIQVENELMDALAKYNGVTLLVSHNMNEVYRICENLVVLSKGQVSTCGCKKDIFENPSSLEAAQLTGWKNISRAKETEKGLIEAIDWGCKLKISKSINPSVSYVGIRPNSIDLAAQEQFNTLKCFVSNISEDANAVTIYLRNIENHSYTEASHIQWEVSKEKWMNIKDIEQPWNVFIDTEKLFLIG